MPDHNELVNMLRTVIQEELNPVHQEFQEFRQEVHQEFQEFRQEVRQELQELRQGQDKLENKVNKLEIRIENEVIEKVSALFDGYSLRGDQIENLQKHIDQRLDSIDIDTSYLVSRVARLEKMRSPFR